MHAPRTTWGYCNAGYVLAGKCIQEISGMKWHSYLNNTFFNPLDMNHTYCYVSDLEHVSNFAKAHTIIDGKAKVIPYGNIDNLAPAGAISSTVEDTIQNGVKDTPSCTSRRRNLVEDTIQNGVKQTKRSYEGSRKQRTNYVIENGVKETELHKGDRPLAIRDTIQHGVKN